MNNKEAMSKLHYTAICQIEFVALPQMAREVGSVWANEAHRSSQ